MVASYHREDGFGVPAVLKHSEDAFRQTREALAAEAVKLESS